MRMDRRGFTLVEMLITAMIFGILMAALAAYAPKIQTYFQRLQLQQRLQSDSGTAMDTMNRLLRGGIASTVIICSCNNNSCAVTAPAPKFCDPTIIPPPPPNSQIIFELQDTTWRQFLWKNNALVMGVGASSTTIAEGTQLAKNVGSVTFAGDFRDLSIVNVDLFMSAPLDVSGDPTHVMTVALPTQSVRMLTTQ